MDDSPATVTRLLARMASGDAQAGDELLPLVYAELRRIAARAMRDERDDHTLQATALVHEAWVRLARLEGTWENRAHFLRVAARAMRHVLVDHARARSAQKRQATRDERTLERIAASIAGTDTLDLIALDDALTRLGETNERLARVVELRFFGGLSADEIGEVLGITANQVHYAWELARAWLHRELARGA